MKTILLLDNRTGRQIEPRTSFTYTKKNNHLFFQFIAYDSSLNSYSNNDNDELYKGDVVEIFLDLGDDFYYEFEVAPAGATFVAKIFNGKPQFINNNFFKSKTNIEANNYRVNIDIDLSSFKENSHIKFNAFRIETKGIRQNYILQALSPPLPDSFHVRNKFVELI